MNKNEHKKVLAQIKELVTKMPVVELAKVEIVTGMQILTNPKYEKFRNASIVYSKKYKIRFPGPVEAVNHEKRMMSKYYEGGWEAVKTYMKKYVRFKEDSSSIDNHKNESHA